MRFIFFLLLFLSSSAIQIFSQGKIYFVLGSDTAIWDGMSTNKYNCYYTFDLYTNPARNTYQVMNPSFRADKTDSYGTPLKMTWWMIGGNMYRYATNTNVPVANSMAMYIMKKHHMNNIIATGDELSLHYHTFNWTDYNGDGIFYWNQAATFMELKEDFDLTLSHFLLEDDVFPVSFRSGWHAMDNDWQNYLNKLLPYSLHNDWPGKHNDTIEPLDNIYDWSLAPSTFIPFHPSPENYQLPGNSKGWNVRSEYMGSVSQSFMDQVFQKSQTGADQVVCLWSHLPEENFLQQIDRVDSIIHVSAGRYPQILFRYCTGVEAMQRWRNGDDVTPPQITISQDIQGGEIFYNISSDEPIFQEQPFISAKDIYENYTILECVNTGGNNWRTTTPVAADKVAKIGLAVTDTLGNLTKKYINYLGDPVFIDNSDAGYSEIRGTFTDYANKSAWNESMRSSFLNAPDTVTAAWNFQTDKSGVHNVFYHMPDGANSAQILTAILKDQNGNNLDTAFLNGGLRPKSWNYLFTRNFDSSLTYTAVITAAGAGQTGKTFFSDAIKVSPLVRDKELNPVKNVINLAEVRTEDTLNVRVEFFNSGIEPVTISSVTTETNTLTNNTALPVDVPAMEHGIIWLRFTPLELGAFSDTITVTSNDPVRPVIKIPFDAVVLNYFELVDNDDSAGYEESGTWATSVAQAWGASSRFAYVSSPASANYAVFSMDIKKTGDYDIFEIVPSSVNASNKAIYEIYAGNNLLRSVMIDQSAGSGNWIPLGRFSLYSGTRLRVKVKDSGQTTSGAVLRSDAVKAMFISEVLSADENGENRPKEYILQQNYPNPFNPSTMITFALPEESEVQVRLYDVLGQQIKVLCDGVKKAGRHNIVFESDGLSGGVYIYTMNAGNFSSAKKMVLLK